MKIQKNFPCIVRDQVKLATDLYMPDQDGTYPVILLRTPYDKDGIVREPLYEHYPEFVDAGYIVAVQDCRGTCSSEGKMNLNGANEHNDGYDSVEFLAAQPFCDGNVGMFGLSYFGFTQIAAASGAPAHLKAICPFMCCSLSSFGTSAMQTVACFHLSWAYNQLLEHPEQYMPDEAFRSKMLPILKGNRDRLEELAKTLPMNENPAALLSGASCSAKRTAISFINTPACLALQAGVFFFSKIILCYTLAFHRSSIAGSSTHSFSVEPSSKHMIFLESAL